jgi:hypothetical protein
MADGGVTTRSIVEDFDVGKDITCGLCPCCILGVIDKLGLVRVEEALHRGIDGRALRHIEALKPADCNALRYSDDA